MRPALAFILLLFLATLLCANTGPADNPATGGGSTSDADIAWASLINNPDAQVIVDQAKTPRTTPRTAAQNGAHPPGKSRESLSSKWEQSVNQARLFQQKYPNDPRVAQARKIEIFALANRTRVTRNPNDITTLRRYLKDNSTDAEDRYGISAALKEIELVPEKVKTREDSRETRLTHARQLIEEFPENPRGYGYLLSVAKSIPGGKAVAMARDLAAMPAAPPEIRAGAQRLLAQRAMEGKPLKLASLDIQKYAGKPLIIYSWTAQRLDILQQVARWARDADLQFLGVNLDGDKDAALEAASRFPLLRDQIFDGAGFDGPLATELCLTMIGSLYIIGGDGVLVDASGHDTAHHKIAGLRKKSGMALITDVTQHVGPDLASGRELPMPLPTRARPDTRSGPAKSTGRVTSVNNTGIGGAK